MLWFHGCIMLLMESFVSQPYIELILGDNDLNTFNKYINKSYKLIKFSKMTKVQNFGHAPIPIL